MLHHRLRSLWWTTLAFVFICLTFHFAILFTYSMPLNPIQYTFASPINAYTNTFFYQNWRLFAPEPISNNLIVSARATFPSSTRSVGIQYTSWKDLTDPLIHAVQQNRFTELQIPELMLSNSVVTIVNEGAYTPGSASYQDISHGKYPPEYLIMVRYACHILNQVYPQTHFESLQLSITVIQPPDFLHYTSNRNKVLSVSLFPLIKYASVV